jgi:oligopeptide transport system ATP-binding protein
VDKPEFVNIGHDHWVYGNKKEIEEYKKLREQNIPVKTITIQEGESKGDENANAQTQTHTAEEDAFLKAPPRDTGSVWYTVLSFFFPILGLIAWLLFKNFRYYRNYKACKKGTVASFIVWIVVILVFFILLGLAVI